MRITRYSRHLALAAVVLASSAGAQGRPKPTRRLPTASAPASSAAASGEASQADVARLQQQIDDQRTLLLRVLQMEREHLDLLVRMSGGTVPTSVAPAAQPLPAQPPEPRMQATPMVEQVSGTEPAPVQAAIVRRAPRPAAKAGATTGAVTGRVSVQNGSLENAVVYVESLRDRPVRGRKHEIKQANKQFAPRFSVVPRDTTVTFPNQDSIFHNVFSLSPGNTFDLGTYRSGDKAGEVTLNTAGVVQVFCNLHSQMSASVLVTPSRYFAMVKKDGTFELDDLPAGKHRLVAWMPNADPVSREVEVTADGQADLSFSLTAKGNSAHTNKFGQPYGSYQE